MKKINMHNKPLSILLVEDDDGDAKALQRAFQKSKIANTMLRAVDGVDALEILKGSNGKEKIASPYLLLVDFSMPRMNGVEFIKSLRADSALHNAIVFVLTTSQRNEDKVASYNLNVAGYILKTTAGENFLNLVNFIDSYWRIVEMP